VTVAVTVAVAGAGSLLKSVQASRETVRISSRVSALFMALPPLEREGSTIALKTV
jgi:hypothetical protein